jgi:hypothetical protein
MARELEDGTPAKVAIESAAYGSGKPRWQDSHDDYEKPHGHIRKLLALGRVEERGIQPVPLAERTSTKYFNVFTIWCSMNANILP